MHKHIRCVEQKTHELAGLSNRKRMIQLLHMFEFAAAAIMFGLIAAGSWGVADFFVGTSTRAVGGVNAALLVNGLEALIYAVLYILFLYQYAAVTTEGVLYALIGSVAFGAAQAGFFKAMRLGPIGLVSSIASMYPLITLVVSVLLFAAGVSAVEVGGIMLIVTGVMVASGLFEPSKQRLGNGPLVALLPALGWGVGIGFISHALSLMDWQTVILIELVTAPIILLLLMPFIKGSEHVTRRSLLAGVKLPVVWIAAVSQMLGLLALNIGIAHKPTEAAVIVAVSSCYPALTIFLALRHLKEKIPLIPLLGGIVGIIGVVVLALG